MSVEGGGRGDGDSRVGFVTFAYLLVVLVLLAQCAIRRFVDRPRHVVFAPIEGELAHFLSSLCRPWVAFLPCPVFLLVNFMFEESFLFLNFLPFSPLLPFFLSSVMVLSLGPTLSCPFRELDHLGHNLLIIGRFGSPCALILKVVHLGLTRGNKTLMGNGK